MNDLLSPTATDVEKQQHDHPTSDPNLDRFLEDVDAIKEDLKQLDALHRALLDANERAKFLYQAAAVRDNRARIEADVATCLKKAKRVKLRLEALDRANAENVIVPGCGPGSSAERTRSLQIEMLRKKLKESMMGFNEVREKAVVDYRETVQRRYYTITGQQPDEATLDELISTGEAETLLQRAIHETGREEVMEVVTEIRERHEASKELEKSLVELHQVFEEMGLLVHAQGEQLNNIEVQVHRASSFIRHGVERLHRTLIYLKSNRAWVCTGLLVLLVVVVVAVVLTIVLNNRKNGNANKNLY